MYENTEVFSIKNINENTKELCHINICINYWFLQQIYYCATMIIFVDCNVLLNTALFILINGMTSFLIC